MLKLAESLPSGARVAVFRLGGKLTMLQGFTEDTAGLIALLKNTGKLTAAEMRQKADALK